MATITSEGGQLKVEQGSNISYYPLDDVTLTIITAKLRILVRQKEMHAFTYADITAPAGADLEAKADAIAAFLGCGTGGGGGGDASAANQLTEIARLDSILAKIEPILSWGTRTQLTILDTGAIKIPANANRKGLRISNENGEDTYYTLTDSAPTFEEDVKLAKKETHFFFNGESGTAAIRFITKSGKSTIVTYQEAT